MSEKEIEETAEEKEGNGGEEGKYRKYNATKQKQQLLNQTHGHVQSNHCCSISEIQQGMLQI